MNSYVARLHIPYTAVQSFIDKWEEKCETLLVYEHPPDSGCKRIHCHFLIENCTIKEDALKTIVNKTLVVKLFGNGDWSFKPYDPDKGKTYLTYMTKGNLSYKFCKNISPDILETARLAWVEPVLGNDKHPGSSKNDDIKELFEAFQKKHDITDMDIYSGFTDMICDRILGTCRTFTMAHIYHKTGKLPFPGTYKQTAGTLFLRVIEAKRPDLFGEALNSLKNIWY